MKIDTRRIPTGVVEVLRDSADEAPDSRMLRGLVAALDDPVGVSDLPLGELPSHLDGLIQEALGIRNYFAGLAADPAAAVAADVVNEIFQHLADARAELLAARRADEALM